MTVAKLIELLSHMDQSAMVVQSGPDHSYRVIGRASAREAEPGEEAGELYEALADIESPVHVVVLS